LIAIYARQSIDKKDSISIDTQIEYASHETYGQEYRVYKDKGYSGKNLNRPAFEQMMNDVDNGSINKIVVYRLDRVSRSIVDFADLMNKLEKKGVSFISATEKFDTSSPMGRAMLYIIAVFAQLERETLSIRIKDNYYDRVKRGAIGGGPAVYGFKLAKKNIDGIKTTVYEPTETLNNVIKMFDRYCEPNTTLADVQRFLTSQNIYTASGHAWDNAKLSSILKSPLYVKADASIYNYYNMRGAEIVNDISEFDGTHACSLVGKRDSNTRKYNDVKNHVLALASHEGIIDSGKFLYVQEKLSQNKQIKNTGKGKHSWLTGIIKCGYCGYAMTVRCSSTKDGMTYYFYDSGKTVSKTCSEKQTHRVSDVEMYVEAELIKKAQNYDVVIEEEKEDLYMIQSELSNIDAKIDTLISSLESASCVTMEYINKRIEALDNEKKEILNRHTQALAKKPNIKLPDFDYSSLSFDDKKYLREVFIDKILLKRDYIEILWK